MAHLAGYLRVSFVGTREADRFHSPQEQTEEIGAWAKGRAHTVDFLEAELDRKGSDPDRPILGQAVEGVKAGHWDGIVVAYLSRAGRGLRLMLDLWDEIEGAGGAVYFARENLDGSTSSGRMQRNILASVAQYELEERRAGFERATKGAVERGIWQRKQTPRGYVKDPTTRKLVIDEQGAAEVKAAAADYLSGAYVTTLAERLGMTQGGVRALLRNRVYLGELKVRSYVKKKAHDPILDSLTFEAVQEKLNSGRRPPRSGEPSLLAGLVRCRACGHLMVRYGGKRSNGGSRKVYRCPKWHSGEVCPDPTAISCRRLDPFVEAVALRELRSLSGRASSVDAVQEVQLEVTEVEGELSAYLQAVDAAGIGSGDAAAGMRTRREKVDQARERLRAEMARVPRLPTFQKGDEIWGQLNIEERSDLLRSLFATVAIAAVGKGRNVPVTDRARLFRFGADVTLPRGRTGTASGIVPIPWPDLDDPRLVSVSGIEDAL
jgi:DNA invertase Pin-like site-specific DNA recombinase